MRRLRRIRQQCRLPDATLARLIRPTNSRTLRRPDKAFTPHPATVPDA
ncbi:mannitol-1-phosphate 5-dehydrogenase [Escherichia coli]|nr:mannitol-1-phosphate 5-dehydrogenase [Escherichia coli]OKU73309.1 mannitol-1-phosphate 5-dehydrogenase [Escherichia coli]OKX10131.1 mannitol-1-phosphate 5-dehydrogenase [Escherichia coli]